MKNINPSKALNELKQKHSELKKMCLILQQKYILLCLYFGRASYDLTFITHCVCLLCLVTYRLDYCDVLYIVLPVETTLKLQLIQKVVAYMLMGASRLVQCILLQKLYWLLTVFRGQFRILVLTYKALYGLGPGHLKGPLLQYLPTHVQLRRFSSMFHHHVRWSWQALGEGPSLLWLLASGMLSPEMHAWHHFWWF